MRSSFTTRSLALAACATLLLPFVLAAKNFAKPEARAAINYPAHDFHRDEKVAIAADPYDTPEKAKLFSVDFQQSGFLPVFFIVTNDGDQPISIANMQITMITAHHSNDAPSNVRGGKSKTTSTPRASANSAKAVV